MVQRDADFDFVQSSTGRVGRNTIAGWENGHLVAINCCKHCLPAEMGGTGWFLSFMGFDRILEMMRRLLHAGYGAMSLGLDARRSLGLEGNLPSCWP